jgi:hypothetical protein
VSQFQGRWAFLGLVTLLSGVVVGLSTVSTARAAISGDTYVGLTPQRLLDTRVSGQTMGPGTSLNLSVAGTADVPVNAEAVAINVTVTDTTAASYLTVYPTGEAMPLSSDLNWTGNQTVANLAIVPVGTDGDLTIYNANGSADVVVDLQGYFVPGGGGGGDYVPLTPDRITDTRAGSGYPYAGDTLQPATTLDIQVAGEAGVPSIGAEAAVLNVTATNTTMASFLSVFPAGSGNPDTSSLNWTAGTTVANRVVVPLGPAGQVSLFNDLGSADVVVDVSGYFTAGASSLAGASLYYPVSPTRVLDTRVDGNEMDAASYLGQQFGGTDGVSDQATAIVANLTSTDTTSAGYYALTPQMTPPSTSDLNWPAGRTVANLDIASLNDEGDAYLYNSQGSADAVIDVFGYFVPLDPSSNLAASPCTSIALTTSEPEIGGGAVDATASATCPAGSSVQYTYWYLAPGASSWTLAGPANPTSTFQYSTRGWADGMYQLMAWASTQPGVFQGTVGGTTISYSPNPTANVPDTFMSTCYSSGFGSVACGEAEAASLDSAGSGEGLASLDWPSALFGLNQADQEFIAADEERVSRGLPPIAGLTGAANQSALTAAQSNTDPDGFDVSGAIAYASNWAEDYGPLGAMFDWVYNDGPGSFNEDCPTAGNSGCWIHRDNVLLDTTTGEMTPPSGYTWVGGTACAPEDGKSYLDACAFEWVMVPTTSVAYDFTWATAVALGA